MRAELRARIDNLPTEPGVYLMKNAAGEVIYVGKAVNLRARVRSYFRANGDDRAFVPFLDTMLDELEVIVVRTEQEALILESELIKRFCPRFNVLLRDDKSFICLSLDLSHEWPRLEVTRAVQTQRAAGRIEGVELVCADGKVGDLAAFQSDLPEVGPRRERGKIRLFGPYSSASAIRETLRFLERHFQLRTCTDRQLAAHHNKGRACLQHQLRRCLGPCVRAVSPGDYAERVREVVQFLDGKESEVIERLRRQMEEAAEALEFERAAALRDRVRAISRSLERQQIVSEDPVDRDVVGLAREASRLVIYLLFIRGGRLIGGHPFPFTDQEFPSEELVASFLQLYYGGEVVIPHEVLLPFELSEAQALETWLTRRRGERVHVRTPRRGAKADLIAMAGRNALQTLNAQTAPSADETKAVLERLQKRLRLSRLPRKIECYDISLFQGGSAVGSGVCFVDGAPFKAGYRRYRIKTVSGTDDFAMLHEVLRRRVRHGDLPDLFLIDGGKGQLASAASALRDEGVTPGVDADLASLAKSRLLESDDNAARRSDERVFLTDTKDPIVLNQNSPELFLLTRLRDEAHRFAITYHRALRSKRALTSDLDTIEGVGPTRRARLLKHFGSLKRLREAPVDDIAAIPGIGAKLAAQIHAALTEAPRAAESDDSGESPPSDLPTGV